VRDTVHTASCTAESLQWWEGWVGGGRGKEGWWGWWGGGHRVHGGGAQHWAVGVFLLLCEGLCYIATSPPPSFPRNLAGAAVVAEVHVR
jgi:hypothetical protein